MYARVDGNATEITAGFTLTADFDSKTGLNKVVLDLSADAGYTAGSLVEIFIAAGTVDSVSVADTKVYEFEIGNTGSQQQANTRVMLALPAVAPAAVNGLLTAPATANTGLADVTRWNNTAVATPTVAGVPEVDVTHVAGSTTDVSAIPSSVAALLARLTSARAGYLDNLNVAGALALSSEVNDVYTRLGAPAGLSIAADIADLPTVAEFNARTLVAADYTIVSDLGVVQTADHTAAIADIPTVAEFNARTIVAASYALEATSQTLVTNLAAVAADLPNRITKNTALAAFTFLMIDSADHVTGKTGLTVTATRSIDGAAFAACANAVTEVANGIYKIDLAAADLNGNVITLKFTATGADARFITIVTQPT